MLFLWAVETFKPVFLSSEGFRQMNPYLQVFHLHGLCKIILLQQQAYQSAVSFTAEYNVLLLGFEENTICI